jgi:tripartite-type tricarboxylate transporter receptor subunit TctC
VTSPERDSTLPDVPTVRESGHPEIEATNWSGLVVPSGTPSAVIERLNTEIVHALRTPEVQEKFRALAISPAPSTPEQFSAFMQSEAARYGSAVRAAGIKAD